MKWDRLHNEYFYFWYFKYMLIPILLYFHSRHFKISGLVLATEYFYIAVLILSLKVEYLSTFYTTVLQYTKREKLMLAYYICVLQVDRVTLASMR